MFRYHNNLITDVSDSYFIMNNTALEDEDRQCNLFCIRDEKTNTYIYKRSIRYCGVQLWIEIVKSKINVECSQCVLKQNMRQCLVQQIICMHCSYTLLAKKVVTPPLKTIKPMWIELLCFHLAKIGMIWTRDCSPTKSDTTMRRHSMQGQVGSSSSETTV